MDLPANWPQHGLVELKNVSTKYGNNDPDVLQDVSLRVMPGNKVGITGRTGSGKSSLFMGLLGFLEYTGTVMIDSVDISKVPRDLLRLCIITIS